MRAGAARAGGQAVWAGQPPALMAVGAGDAATSCGAIERETERPKGQGPAGLGGDRSAADVDGAHSTRPSAGNATRDRVQPGGGRAGCGGATRMSGRSNSASPAKRLVKFSPGGAQYGRLEGRDLLHMAGEPCRVAGVCAPGTPRHTAGKHCTTRRRAGCSAAGLSDVGAPPPD